jgi:hypothetical protein
MFSMKISILITVILALFLFSTGCKPTTTEPSHEYIPYNAGYRIVNPSTLDTITINKAADNHTLLRYFGQQAEDDLALYQAAFNVLSSGQGKGYRDAAADATVKNLIKEKGLKLFGGPMLGQYNPRWD